MWFLLQLRLLPLLQSSLDTSRFSKALLPLPGLTSRLIWCLLLVTLSLSVLLLSVPLRPVIPFWLHSVLAPLGFLSILVVCLVRASQVRTGFIGLGLLVSGLAQFEVQGLAVPTGHLQLTSGLVSTQSYGLITWRDPQSSSLRQATGGASEVWRIALQSPRPSQVSLRRGSTWRQLVKSTWTLPPSCNHGAYRSIDLAKFGHSAVGCRALSVGLAYRGCHRFVRDSGFGGDGSSWRFSGGCPRWIYSGLSSGRRKRPIPSGSCRSIHCALRSWRGLRQRHSVSHGFLSVCGRRGFCRVPSLSAAPSSSLFRSSVCLRPRAALCSSFSFGLGGSSQGMAGGWRRKWSYGLCHSGHRCGGHRWRGIRGGRSTRDGRPSRSFDASENTERKEAFSAHSSWARAAFHWRKAAHRRKLGVLPARADPGEHRSVSTSAKPYSATARTGEEDHGSFSSVGFPPCTFAPAHLIGVGQSVSKAFNHCPGDWCSPANSCVYEPGTVAVSFGEAPRSTGIGGGERRDGPIYLQRPLGLGCAPAIESAHCSGVTDSNSECGPLIGAWRRDFWCQYQRCTRQSEATRGASSPTWILLQLGVGLYGKKNAAYHVHRGEPRGVDESRHIGDQILGAFRWFWEASRIGVPSISGDDNHGLFAGGEPTSSSGRCVVAGGNDRPGCLGQRKVRLGQPSIITGRPTVADLHSQSPQRALKGAGVHTSGKSAMDHGGSCVRERIGFDLSKEVGIGSTSKVKSICQLLSGARPIKTKGCSQEEGKRVRKRKSCPSTKPGRGRLDKAGSATYEPGKAEGLVSNPLTSRISFHRWISLSPSLDFEDPHKACLVSLTFLCDSAAFLRDVFRTPTIALVFLGLLPW